MEKLCPWCGQPSDRGRLKNRTEQHYDLADYDLQASAIACGISLESCASMRFRQELPDGTAKQTGARS